MSEQSAPSDDQSGSTETQAGDPTQTGELGPMPAAKVEPGEESPGGADSVPLPDQVVAADLDPTKNPAIDDSPAPVKDSLEEGEDTDTAATRSQGGDDAGQDEEASS